MASSVRFGSTTVLILPPEVISRRKVIKCENCPKTLSEDEIAVSKQRGGQPVKYYCTECAQQLFMLTDEEYKHAMEVLGSA
ncbi:MAG: hypothetical protein ACTSPB_01505 [Candidatus Thorarchaeota archaeon]